MSVQTLLARDRRPAPWKNGGGVTREIAAFPPGAELDGFDWRISMATVSAGGPFSSFPGVDRVLSVLEGELILIFTNRPALKLTAETGPAVFPGEAAVRADSPSNAVTDLNVMTRRGQVHARVDRLWVDPTTVLRARETTLILSLSPGVRLRHGGDDYELGFHDAVLVEEAEGEPIGFHNEEPAGLFQIDFTRR